MLRINFFKQPLFLVKIRGESMWPALIPGKTYLASGFLKPRKGDVIIFRNPKNSDEVLVKRIVDGQDHGYKVDGTVSWASSSNDFGRVPRECVLGKILGLTMFSRFATLYS